MWSDEPRKAAVPLLSVALAIGVALPITMSIVAGVPGSRGTASRAPAGASPTAAISTSRPTTSAAATASPPVVTPNPTTDREPPSIVGHTPGTAATGVSPGAAISIGFSEPVLHVTGATVQLINVAGGWTVNATVAYDAATRRATLRPRLLMYPATAYRVVVLRGITDAAGNALAPAGWTFQTGSG